ncbi:hypothetical protein BDR26DRAFT_504390 [Obelidium mucronatum]|nr:hypothetical protein BDR26DRAFT_504390 [Obelidium mucronatum]
MGTSHWAQTPSLKTKPPFVSAPGSSVHLTKSKEEEPACPEWFTSFADWVDCLETNPDNRASLSSHTSPAAVAATGVSNGFDSYSCYYGEEDVAPLPRFTDFSPTPQRNGYLADANCLTESNLSRKQSFLGVDSPSASSILHNGGGLRPNGSNSSLTSTLSPSSNGRIANLDSQQLVAGTAVGLNWVPVSRVDVLLDPAATTTPSYPLTDSNQFGFSNSLLGTDSLMTTPPTYPAPKSSPPLSSNHSSPAFQTPVIPLIPKPNTSLSIPPTLDYSGVVAAAQAVPLTNRQPHSGTGSVQTNTPWNAAAVRPSMLSPVSPNNTLQPSVAQQHLPARPAPHHPPRLHQSGKPLSVRPVYARSNSSISTSSSSSSGGSSNHNPAPTTTTTAAAASGIIPAVVMKGIKCKDPVKPGDWICPNSSCRFHNFARRTSCVACGTSDKSAGRF